jgi:O-antigen/teichoic acid export membrane protein
LEKKQTGLLAGSAVFFVASLIVYAARFATSVIVARTIGVEGKGVYTLVLMVGSLLVLFLSFGLHSSFTYFTASKRYDSSDLAVFSLIASLLLSLVGGALFFWLYTNLLANNLLAGISPAYILLVLALLPFSLLSLFFSSIVLGKQQLIAYNAINVCRVVSNLVFQVISFLMGGGVTGAILAWFASNLVAFIVSVWLVRADIFHRPHFSPQILRPATTYGIKSYLANLFTFFNYRLDAFLVNFYRGAADVGLYSTGVGVAELIWYIPNAISSTLFPKSSTLTRETSARLTAQASRQSLLVAVGLSLAGVLLGPVLIPLFYGADFAPSVEPFLLLLPGILGITITKIISANLAGVGKPQYTTYTAATTVVVTILLDVLLIPGYGINGAAVASTVAYLASAVLIVMWFCRESGLRWTDTIIPRREDLAFLVARSRQAVQSTRSILNDRSARRRSG